MNLQWWSYPYTSPLVYPVAVDAKVVATCPGPAQAASLTNAKNGTASAGDFIKTSLVALSALLGMLAFF